MILPQTVVNRLYARPLNNGAPDFIENSVRLTSPGDEDATDDFPVGVFVRE